MASPTWEAIKAQYRASDLPQVCAVCGTSERLHMHHTTYKRFGGRELLTDLMPLCEHHHRGWHRHAGVRLTKDERAKVVAALAYLASITTVEVTVLQPAATPRAPRARRIAKYVLPSAVTMTGDLGPCAACGQLTRIRTANGRYCSEVCGGRLPGSRRRR